MAKTIGVVLSDRVTAALIQDRRIEGVLRQYPANAEDEGGLVELHTEGLIRTICEQVMQVRGGHGDIVAVGVAVPGIVRRGVVEDSANLPQLKGARIAEALSRELRETGFPVPVHVINDADGVAAGLAANSTDLNTFLRVWTLGVGIGYGCFPFLPGVWEGGHIIVSMDEKENYCGCGGRGHLEGIMGHRAMRLRFLDMEPEEVFAEARKGNERCLQFVKLWHRALAAGIGTSIHLSGPGKFLLTGFNVRFVDLAMLKEYVYSMVKMSPLQSYTIDIVEDNIETRVIGSGVAAEHAVQGR